MIDYISVTSQLSDKDIPFFGYCQQEASYSSGWVRYNLQGCKRVTICYNSVFHTIKLKGSIPYYWQGHNLTYNKSSFYEAIEHINSLLHVNFWNGMLEVLEYGIIVNVQSKPKEYISRHSALPAEHLTLNEKARDKGKFRWWNDKNVSLKMYDAKANIQCKLNQGMKEAIINSGWNPEEDYLKWEAHYIKPEVLNNGKGIILADIMQPKWENRLKEDLYIQYKRLIPMKNIIMPKNKKDLSTADIITLAFAEENINQGKSIQELKKLLYAKINLVPDNILTKPDKDLRKRQVKKLMGKLQEEPESRWDISSKIEEALK